MMEWQPRGNRRERVVKQRMLVMALGVILALLGVAAPIASAENSSSGGHQSLSALTAAWWNWAAQDPSPLVGNYKGGEKCDGKFVKGVFFLAGSSTAEPVKRICTVPDDTPILFPVVNALCSKAFGDPRPYTQCARDLLNQVLVDSTTFARLDGQSLRIRRIASGPFSWKVESADNPFGVPKGTFPAASVGLWVYLAQGLPEDKHTLRFGGEFPNFNFRQDIT
jgi:hypothetical protein